MIIGEIRRYLRDYNSIRVSRSLRDIAYKAIYAKENYIRQNLKEPTMEEIAKEIGIEKEMIVYALDAIQSPVSLYEPVYSEGGDTLYVMDQISDRKNKEEHWLENLSLKEAMNRPRAVGNGILLKCVFMRAKHRWKLRMKSAFLRRRSAASKKTHSRPCEIISVPDPTL